MDYSNHCAYKSFRLLSCSLFMYLKSFILIQNVTVSIFSLFLLLYVEGENEHQKIPYQAPSIYTHIMIDSSSLLLQPVCESLRPAFLFMTNPRLFKQKSISKCRVRMTHKLLTWFTAIHCMMLGRSILVHAHCCVLILQPSYEWFCRRTFPNQICHISIIKSVHKIYQI